MRARGLPFDSSVSGAGSQQAIADRAAALDFVSHSPLHTERLGERLGRLLGPGDVVALWGELGVGKTQVAKGIALGLGVAAPATSPTFVVVNEYDARVPMYHVDLYRMSGTDDLRSVGWEEYLDLGGVVVIEWPDRLGEALPEERVDLFLEHLTDTKRRVRLEAHGERARGVLAEVASALGA